MALSHSSQRTFITLTGCGILLTTIIALASWFMDFSPLLLFVLAVGITTLLVLAPEVGLSVILLSSMFMERWFTLQTLVFSKIALKLYPVDVVVVLTAAILLLRMRPRSLLPTLRPLLPAFLFFVLAIIIGVTSMSRGGDTSLIFSAIKNILFSLMILVITLATLETREQWKRLCMVILLGGILIIPFLIAGIAQGAGIWSAYTPLSTSGTRLLASTHAFFLTMPLFILLAYRAYGKRVFGAFDAAVTGAWIVGILVSLLRHLWIGVAVGIVVLLFSLPRTTRKALVLFGAKIGALAFVTILFFLWFSLLLNTDASSFTSVLSAITERFAALNPFDVSDESALFRLAALREAFESVQQHPLFGIGFGNDLLLDFETFDYALPVRELHNHYMSVLVQMGIAGLMVFGWFLLRIARYALSTLRMLDDEMRPLYAAVFAFFVLFATVAAFGTYFETNFFLVFFWTAVGMLVKGRTLTTQSV